MPAPGPGAAARKRGDKTFFTGKPCKKGHVCERYTVNQACVECALPNRGSGRGPKGTPRQLARDRGERYYDTGVPCTNNHFSKRHVSNGNCLKCENDVWSKTDRARELGRLRAVKIAASWSEEEREAKLAYRRRWGKDNRGHQRSLIVKRKMVCLRQTPRWADHDAIKEIYKACPPGHHVDHEVPVRGRIVSGLHVENNLRHLRAEENMKKNAKFDQDAFSLQEEIRVRTVMESWYV